MVDRREFLIGSLGLFVGSGVRIGAKYPDAFKGVPILRMDYVNKNNRIYPLKVVEEAVAKISNNAIFGLLEMPTSGVVELSKVAFQAENFHMTNGTFGPMLHCDIKTLENIPLGRLFKEMIEKEPRKFEYRTAGIGGGNCDDNGVMTITKFELTCVTAIPYNTGS